jgi:hypothetical protein
MPVVSANNIKTTRVPAHADTLAGAISGSGRAAGPLAAAAPIYNPARASHRGPAILVSRRRASLPCPSMSEKILRTGILGCGPISQFAHLESVQKARNTVLQAVCDADGELASRFGSFYDAESIYDRRRG